MGGADRRRVRVGRMVTELTSRDDEGTWSVGTNAQPFQPGGLLQGEEIAQRVADKGSST
jgi:hypothetical protein